MKPLLTIIVALMTTAALASGCGSHKKTQDKGFYTSGDREADQRAEQRIAKDQQLRGESQKTGSSGNGDKKSDSPTKKPLFERLGGEASIAKIVDDFVNRALADPRVNWERKGVKHGGILHRGQSVEWKPTPDKVAEMKKHITQFLSLATGGPAHYDGREMKEAHTGLRITNAEFDAAVGDLKATLDSQRVPVDEQKELLAIIESTRPQIVVER